MGPLLQWQSELGPLREPALLVALEGFVDAGAVAATAGMFLRHRWQSQLVATFDREELIDYRARRPTVVVDSGLVKRVQWPDIELLVARPDGPRDALLLLGPEPDARWSAFAQSVVDLCRQTGVHAVVMLGAYPAAAPHTRPVRIMRASNNARLVSGEPAGQLVPDAGDVPGYTGPIGVATALQVALGDAGIPSVGLWAEVPHYIAASPNPAAALALVRAVSKVMGTDVDATELEAAAKLHAEQVDEAVTEHPEAAELVEALEHHVDAGNVEERLPSGDDIAAEIERFLRNQ